MKDDLFAYVKGRLTAPNGPAADGLLLLRAYRNCPDFSAFGGVEE